jgi:hypothetical protein
MKVNPPGFPSATFRVHDDAKRQIPHGDSESSAGKAMT